jgi:hypothetical protein
MTINFLIGLILISLENTDTPYCNDSVIITKNTFNHFLNTYIVPKIDVLNQFFRSLIGAICGNYQLCLGDAAKCIIGLQSSYKEKCLISLKNLANLSSEYSSKDPSAIKGNLGGILDKVSQYVSDCEPHLNYKKKNYQMIAKMK